MKTFIRNPCIMPVPINKDMEYWDAMAQRYGADACGYLTGYQQYEEFLRRRVFERDVHIYKGIKVLDIGAGAGNWCRWIAGKGAEVTGIDISSHMIDIATGLSRNISNTAYRHCAIEDADFASGNFDLVISITVLQHITKEAVFARAIENIVRMLKPGGRICCIEYSPKSKPENIAAADYMVYRSQQEWIDSFKNAGCVLVKQRPVRFLAHRVFPRISGIKPKILKDFLMTVPLFIDTNMARFAPRALLDYTDLCLFLFKKDPLTCART